MKRYIFSILILIILPSSFVGAVSIMVRQDAERSNGSQFVLPVTIDTAGATVNAAEGLIRLTGNNVYIDAISDSNSVVSFWVDQPRIDDAKNQVSFSGVIPGGFKGHQGLLFTIIGHTVTVGTVSVHYNATSLLLNDGLGTRLTPTGVPYSFTTSVSNESSLPPSLGETDVNPPEIFQPELGRYAEMYHGHWFVAFSTQDKGAGVDYYEIQESNSDQPKDHSWQRATSPYELRDQSLHKYIHVRAVDKSGNIRVSTLAPSRQGLPYEPYSLYSILIAILLVGFGITFFMRKKS